MNARQQVPAGSGAATPRVAAEPSARVRQAFHTALETGGAVVRAPGRVNLIGEHTDYNDGLAMPAAIDLATWVALQPRDDETLEIESATLGRTAHVDLAAPLVPVRDWTDYVTGVAWALREAGHPVRGATLAIYSDVPLGAGLASSAALEVGVAMALLGATGTALDRLDIARMCRNAENGFAGAQTGPLDQMAVTHGWQGCAFVLDCRTLAVELTPVPDSVRFVVCNSMVKHEHAGGGYNQRRRECEEALEQLRTQVPRLRSLRDLTAADFEMTRSTLPPVLQRRVRHVLAENARVLDVAEAIPRDDRAAIARGMAASHASLRDLFEVSTPELDKLVELAWLQPGIIGARMMGGGFGGSVLALVEAPAVDRFRAAIADGYAQATGVTPEVYVCEPSDGAGLAAPPW
jgi:galactokinase